MVMYEKQALHPLSDTLVSLDPEVYGSMFNLFEQIGIFWGNMTDATPCKSLLYTFMDGRMRLYPIYRVYYIQSGKILDALIKEMGNEKAYRFLFTDKKINQKPIETPLALVRQKVSNEFISLQLSLGGFKKFGADNYLGYIGGAYIPGEKPPYRIAKEQIHEK